jgi:uncharacterized membrane protein YczE
MGVSAGAALFSLCWKDCYMTRQALASSTTFEGRLYRWSLLLVGLALFGAGVALMVRSQLGLGPWDALHEGISRHTHLQIGTVTILTGVPVLLGWIPLRQRPGIGTVLNILCIGLATNATLAALPIPTGLPLRLLCLVTGILLVGLGSGMYLSSHFGAGPRDGLMLGLHRRTGFSVRAIRTGLELSVLLIGWTLGGTVGLGTLLFAFGIGPVVQPALRFFGGLPDAPRPESVHPT